MMGLALQRVIVAVLLAVTFVLATPLLNSTTFMVAAATTEDVEAGGRKKEKEKKEPAGSEKKTEETAKDADSSTAKPAELPPLDLGTGVSAKEKPAPEDSLATGVTATSNLRKDGKKENSTPSTPQDSTDSLDPKRLWTPNSGRFLLKDRQADLSLTSNADTVDKGDGVAKKPVTTTASKPAPTMPAITLPAAATHLEMPDQVPDEAPGKPESGDLADLPAFIDGDTSSTIGGEPVKSPAPDAVLEDGDSEGATVEDSGNSKLVFDQPTTDPGAGQNENGVDTIGVIRPFSAADEINPQSDQITGNAGLLESNEELGQSIVGISPWRGAAVFLFCLGLIFAAYWASQKFKGKIGGLSNKTLSVIETIGIGAGRQIIIIEMHNDALILGVTPHSINLLDKVPMETLNNGYNAMVGGIISREGTALPEQWEERPSFQAEFQTASLAPPISSGSYGPSGQTKTSIAELRRTRQHQMTSKAYAQVAKGPDNPSAKDELIGRFRSQLNRFEE